MERPEQCRDDVRHRLVLKPPPEPAGSAMELAAREFGDLMPQRQDLGRRAKALMPEQSLVAVIMVRQLHSDNRPMGRPKAIVGG